jgi:hypothetical protein
MGWFAAPDASLAGTGQPALGPAARVCTGLPGNTASPPIPSGLNHIGCVMPAHPAGPQPDPRPGSQHRRESKKKEGRKQ